MARVVLDRTFKAEVQREPEFIGEMTLRVNATAAAVERAAPERTGYYKRRVRALSRIHVPALDVARKGKKPVPPPKGDGYAVVDTDPFAHLVEAGSVNNPPYSPLRRGARAAGLRLEDPHTP